MGWFNDAWRIAGHLFNLLDIRTIATNTNVGYIGHLLLSNLCRAISSCFDMQHKRCLQTSDGKYAQSIVSHIQH